MAKDAERIDLGTHALRVRQSGKGERTFVCLHGFVDTLDVWDGLAPLLGRLGRVIRIEQRAHGFSTAPAGAVRREDLAADLIASLDQLGIARAVLVGHSLGGVAALTAALAKPARVEALVLIGTASQCNERTAQWYGDIVRAGEVNALDGLARAIHGPMSSKKVDGFAPGLVEIARSLRSLHDDPLTPRLGEVQCPALLIVGDRDPMGTTASTTLEKGLPRATLAVVKGQGHWVHVDAPERTAQIIATWLSSL